MESELDMFDGFKRISKNMDECTPIRGHPDIKVFEYKYRVNIDFDLEALFIPVHLPTHLDIALDTLDRIPRHKESRKYHSPQIFRAFILNFSYKVKILQKYLTRTREGVFEEIWPYIDIEYIENENILWKILKNLEITKNEVEKLIKGHKSELENSFLIFRTDWFSNFAKIKSNLNDAMMEMYHAYLFHPYLGKDVIDFLLENKIVGIGTDSPDLENPISFIDHRNVLPGVKRTRDIAIREGMLEENGNYRRIVHNDFLQTPIKSKRYFARYLLECLCRLKKIQGEGNTTKGFLMVVQMQPTLYHYGVVCEAFFKKVCD